jgi:multisubunit Na+/H+ antiporter MnhG subunit
MNTDEPFGLPNGTIRAIIALAMTVTLVEQVLVGAIDDVAFLAIAGPFLGYYIAQRGIESSNRPPTEDTLPAPFTGEEIDV